MAPNRRQSRTPEPATNDPLTQTLQQLTQVAQALSDAALRNARPPPPPVNANSDVARQVSNHRPPTFFGEEDPAVLEEWIRTLDKILGVVECPEERRVEIASFYFGHEADLWWIHEGPTHRQEPGFNWESLKARLRERFYPTHIKASMYEEFLHLKQGTATVVEYHKRFLELARFAPELVPTEVTKVERFVSGLNFEARKALVVSRPRTLNEAYVSAANLYRIQLLQRGAQEQMRRRNTGSGAPPVKRTRNDIGTRSNNPTNPRPPPGSNEANPRNFPCPRCNKSHRGKDCAGNPWRCFNCGEEGHKAFQCTRPQRPRPTTTGQHGGTGHQGGYGAPGKVFVMSQTQADLGNEEDLEGENPIPEDEDHTDPAEENPESEFCLG